MKKILIPIISLLCGTALMAQNEFDALKFSETEINGTARYMSMAGAFGALGGDGSSIVLNPAGLGVYRKSEMSISTGLYNAQTSSIWGDEKSKESKYKVPFNNFTYVVNLGESGKKSGLVNSNFAFSFNKLKNFNRNTYITGMNNSTSLTDYIANYTNQSGINFSDLSSVSYSDFSVLPILAFETYLIDTVNNNANWQSVLAAGEGVNPSFTLTEEGYINEWNFAYAANISNKLYLGASVGVQSLEYSATREYQEDFTSNKDGFVMSSNQYTEGTGYNFKIGTIVRPIDMLRIGASFQTPTFYKLTDTYDARISSEIGGNLYNAQQDRPYLSYYKLQGPLKYDFSLAVIFGKIGLISADYGIDDYTSMTLREDNGSAFNFRNANNNISNTLKMTQTMRIGAEIKASNEVSLRAGYAQTTTSMENNAYNTLNDNTARTDTDYFTDKGSQYFSGGIGYRETSWYFDFTYLAKINKQEFHPYYIENSSTADVTTRTNNFIATLGFRF